jgi:Gpi18-like mannosyltransferase
MVLVLIGCLATRYLSSSGQVPPRWLACFSGFDGGWYLDIARDGYFFDPSRQSSIAFAPLLPMLMRIIGRALGSSDDAFLLAGIFISNVALLVSLIFMMAIAREIYGDRDGEKVGSHAVWYLLICPGTLFLSAVYPMSLMLAISAGAIWFARRGRWGMAGAIGMLAPLARPDGVLLVLPLLFEAVKSRRVDRRLAWLLMIPAICGIWLAAQWLAFGTPTASVQAQKAWDPSPFEMVFHSSRAPLILGVGAFFVLLMMLGWCTLPGAYSLYSSLFLAVMLSAGRLWSLPRFVVILFPCFITLAWLGTRWRWLHVLYVVTATLIAALFMLRFSLGLWVA